ncbi:hypothetical protein K456DRAFT_742238 [Colletotrichum gloeosporioides 23]|nr:hypothetical protein K456DRAFT_742238 [Colletotrichum gloeosporioides 23]
MHFAASRKGRDETSQELVSTQLSSTRHRAPPFPALPTARLHDTQFQHRKQALLAKWYSASLVMRRSGVRFTHEASRAFLLADDFFLHFCLLNISACLSGCQVILHVLCASIIYYH